MIDLVTGGAGFIGSHLVRRLVAEGRTVRVADDFSTGSLERIQDLVGKIELVRGDLVAIDLRPVVSGVSRIFHMAAIPSVPRSVREPLPSHQSIATGTLRLLIAARAAGVRCFVLSSSSSVYGETSELPKREGLTPRPISPYGVAKLAAEGYARAFSGLYGVHTVSLRYFNVFGPGQDPASPYAAVIPIFVTRALAGRPVEIFGDGLQTRDFTYVENVVTANLAAAAADVSPGRVYNIAAGEPRSLLDLVRELEAIIGRPLAIEHKPQRPGDIRHSHADITLARRELGWVPTVSFTDGLRHMVLQEQPVR
jgi:UDP-glucose 4-epimerase